MDKTSPSNASAEVQIQSLVGELRFHMPYSQRKQNVKQKPYCNKFNKDFKNGPHLKKQTNSERETYRVALTGFDSALLICSRTAHAHLRPMVWLQTLQDTAQDTPSIMANKQRGLAKGSNRYSRRTMLKQNSF